MATTVFTHLQSQALPALPGGVDRALLFPAADGAGGYHVQPGLDGTLTSYSLVYDLLIPAGAESRFTALLQTDLSNGGDGDLFIRNDTGTGSLGISGTYEGELSFNAWHRLAFTFSDLGNGKTQLAKYIDGVLAGRQEVETARYAIDGQQGFLILADEDGETNGGALGGFLFQPGALSAEQVASLGGARSGGILPEGAAPAGATQFDFAAGDLGAGFGPGSLTPRDAAQAGRVGFLSELGLPPLPDAPEGVLRFPAADSQQGYVVKPGIAGPITTYTLVYDLQINPDTMANYAGLFQTDLTNSSDSDLFLRWTGEGVYGTGISGQYEGAASGAGWHRIGFTIADQGDGNALLVKYIDGVRVGQQSVATSRFTIDGDKGFLVLTDEDGEVAGGFLAGFAFTDVALSGEQMQALGGTRAGGIFAEGAAPGRATQFDFETGDFSASFGDGTMNRRTVDGSVIGPAEELGAAPLPGSQNEGVIGFPATEPGDGYAILPGTEAPLASYTLIYDLLIPKGQEGQFGALLQTGRENGGDADLFLRLAADGTIGLGVGGQYDGAMRFDSWHRVAITVRDAGDGTAVLGKYVDGVKVGEQSVDAARFTIDAAKGFMVFADDDGETWSGWLNSLHLTDRAMAEAEIAALGGARAGGVLPTPPADGHATQFDFTGDTLSPSYGTGQMIEVGLSAGPVLLHGLADQRVTPAQQSLDLDIGGMFQGEALTYAVTTSDGRTVTGATVENGKLHLTLGAVGYDDVTITATDAAGNSASDSFRLRMAGENAYTIAVLPDTQDYVFAGNGQKILNGMTQWLADNAGTLNLRFVMSVGDVVASNQPAQWDIAKQAFATLNGVTPYSMLPGNHDQGSNGSANNYGSLQSEYFSVDYMRQHSTLGGTYDQEPGLTNNAWYSFAGADGTQWVVLALEFGARDDVLRWAGEVLDAHPGARAILTTHHYTNMGTRADNYSGPLFAEGTGKDYGIGASAENANDGEDMWQGFVAKHSNISFVFSGHVFGDGAETIVSYNEAGKPVYQMLVNYQNGIATEVTGNGNPAAGGNGGNGAIRLVTIDPDNDAVYTETYLSATGEYLTGSRGDPEPSRDGSGGSVGTPQIPIQPVRFGSVAELGLPALPEGEGHAITAPQFDSNNGLRVKPGFAPADGGTTFDAYTLVYDLHLPAQSGLASLFQSDLNNITDGDLWLNFRDGYALIGTDGQDEGRLPLEGWHRLAITLERVGEGGSTFTMKKYVDGVLQGTQTVGAAYNIGEQGFLIFADDSGETPRFSLSSFAFLETALGEAEVAALGGVTAAGPFGAPPAGARGVQFDFEAGNFTPSFGSGSLSQSIGTGGQQQLTGRYREQEETLTGADLGTPVVQFRAKAGDDQVVSATGAEGATVVLDGSGSVDALRQVTRYEWLDADGEVIATGAKAEVALEGGLHRLTLRATDAQGTVSTDTVKVAVTDGDTLFFDNFNDGDALGWRSPGGNWQVKGSVHSRDVAVEGIAAAEGTLRAFDGGAGIMSWQGQGSAAWSGYTVSATLQAEDQKAFGLVAYYQDDANHYRLSFDVARHERLLVKVQNGTETVLAREVATSPFDRDMAVELAVRDGRLLATLDGEALFGGPVRDSGTPLAGGTVGFYSAGQRQVFFDDMMVRQDTLLADAGKPVRVVDTDGDGVAEVSLSALASLGIEEAASIRWSIDGKTLAEGAEARLALGTGTHLLRLDLEGAQGRDSDTVQVTVIAAQDVLLREDFSGGAAPGWRFVDEGEIGLEASWGVVDGVLQQSSNRYSRQLGGSGDTAPSSEWNLNWSPLGDGIFALRKGTYALYEGDGAAAWTDYAVDLHFTAPAGGGAGVLLHYKDAANYYKLEFDNQTGLAQLFSLKDGIEQTLWQGPARYDATGENHLHAEILGGKLQAWLGGTALFTMPIEIHDTEEGSVALYNWGNAGIRYDSVQVVRLASETPAVRDVRGTAGDDTLQAGTGDVLVDGLGGHDTVVLSGAIGGYRILHAGGELRLSTAEDTVTLRNIEAVRFADGLVDLAHAKAAFDPLHYMQANADVLASGMSAEQHYDQHGWREGRDPNAIFSTSGYLSANGDVADAGMNPLQHYLEYGAREGRDPSARFDAQGYLARNADVAEAGVNPLEHYLAHGISEGRSAGPAIGQSVVGGFDSEYYLLANPDVGAAGMDAQAHWRQHGQAEGRNPNAYFDTRAYLEANPDVAASGMDPLEHYSRFGWQEGRQPSASFDAQAYLRLNPDVAAAGMNPLEHYLAFGHLEGRVAADHALL